MRYIGISILGAVVASLWLSTAVLAGGSCMSHYNKCKVVRPNNAGIAGSADCESRLNSCKSTGVWTDGDGRPHPVKK